ncbi:P-loop containing nucleoside triphosphate hydrolase protein [Mycena latifolia]|nr:P-loop containing nucleoside triphosphate hydrolase protein [Mycena latifolia]
MLPGYPKIFHGRDEELNDMVQILLHDPPRIAILGTGGMGKTSLAIAALHQHDVCLKYQSRFFVRCHSTPTCAELVLTIAAQLGFEKGSGRSQRIYQHFSSNPPALLVLDNFETPWEPSDSRREIEEFLALLADVPQLALVITMRGSERPAQVKWTRPFLQPLKPLPDSAALETFRDIADDCDVDDNITALLDVTGNLPLAVTLMASIAAHEGCETVLSRWKTESTQLLSDGFDQRSSLNISIMLSFSSARMTSAAQDLLGILSLLPDGVSDTDLTHSEFPILNTFTSKATLIRTALAYTDNTGRLKTLVPIQEHIRRVHHLPPVLRVQLRRRFHRMLDLWNGYVTPPDVVAQISATLGNFHGVLLDGLEKEDPDILQTLQSILHFKKFYRLTRRGWSSLMLSLAARIQHWQNDPMYGKFLVERLRSSEDCPFPDVEAVINAGTRYFRVAARNDMEKGIEHPVPNG